MSESPNPSREGRVPDGVGAETGKPDRLSAEYPGRDEGRPTGEGGAEHLPDDPPKTVADDRSPEGYESL